MVRWCNRTVGGMLRIELSFRGMLVAGLAIVAALLLVKLWSVVLLLVTALIFMGALLPYVTWLVGKGVPRIAASLLVIVTIAVVLFALFAIMLPNVVDQFQSLAGDLPGHARRVDEQLRSHGIDLELERRVREVNWDRLISGSALDYGTRIVVGLFSSVTIAVLTVYLLIDAPDIARVIYKLVPQGREPEAERLLASFRRVVGGYIRGQTITSASIGAYTFVMLAVLGVPNALAFGVLAAFMDIVPMVGAVLAVGPPVVAAFEQSPTRAFVVLGLMVAYQQFEDHYLIPRVYGSTLRLPPFVVLLAAACGAQLLGMVGVLLALPAASAGRVLVEYWLERRQQLNLTVPMPRDERLAPDSPAEGSA